MKTILREIERIDQEVTRAVSSYYILKTIHQTMARNQRIHAALNATSWASSHILFSLECTFFIQFERVFDKTSQHSLDKVVDLVVSHANRINSKAEPSLLRLRSRVDYYRKRAEPYRNIRSKVFAHPVLRENDQIQKIFGKTKVSDVEAILVFLQRCVSSLRMNILNGHEVNLHAQRLPLKSAIVRDTKRFLNHLGGTKNS